MKIATPLEKKRALLEGFVREMGSVVVAYSGGVDSSLVAEVAHHVLGERALAVTSFSPSVADEELEGARDLAARRGWAHRVVSTDEMSDARYVVNDGRRCFFCKTELYSHLVGIAREDGYAGVVNGTNADDLGDYRPGLEAAANSDVRSPLVEAKITKADVRALARDAGLPVWDKPAQPCLASRIPYGTPVSVKALRMVGKAERRLRELGFPVVRVRHYGESARVEVPQDKFARFEEPGMHLEVTAALAAAGYSRFELDPKGFRSGSLNADLKTGAAH